MTTFTKLEQQKEETLRLLADWPSTRLAYRPSPNEWTAVEVLDHLVKVESGITRAARQGLQAPHRLGLRDRLGFVFLDRLFRSPARVKAPKSVPQVLPDSHATLADVSQRWSGARIQLSDLLAEVAPSQLQAGVFRHPVSGWMSIPQILRFFSVHIDHHRMQLNRIRAASEGK